MKLDDLVAVATIAGAAMITAMAPVPGFGWNALIFVGAMQCLDWLMGGLRTPQP